MLDRVWWQRPRLLTEQDVADRRVGWAELFYDLVFVIVVAEAAEGLAEHVSWTGVGSFALTFVAIWWVWIGGTFYTERFHTEDISYRLITFLQMLAVGAMAIFAHDATGAGANGFALSYAAGRALITLFWVRGGYHAAEARPVTHRFALGFSASILLFVASVFVAHPAKLLLWGIALLIDLGTPLVTLRHQATLPRFTSTRLPERFGLFVIIVLGEVVIGTIRGVAQNPDPDPRTFFAGALGMGLAFTLWWLYFDIVQHKGAKPGVAADLARSYLHLPFIVAVAALGSALRLVVMQEGAPTLDPASRWLLAASVALALASIAAFQPALEHKTERAYARAVGAGTALAALLALTLGAAGRTLPPVTLLAALLGLVTAALTWSILRWFRDGHAERAAEQADR